MAYPDLTEISTFGWFTETPGGDDLLSISTFGWYNEALLAAVLVAFAGVGLVEDPIAVPG